MLSQWQSLLVTIALAVSGAHSAPSGEHGLGAHRCESFTAPIAAKAVNVGNISLNSTGSGTISVGPGPFKLAFHFCTPSRPTKRAKILQVLVHGEQQTVVHTDIVLMRNFVSLMVLQVPHTRTNTGALATDPSCIRMSGSRSIPATRPSVSTSSVAAPATIPTHLTSSKFR